MNLIKDKVLWSLIQVTEFIKCNIPLFPGISYYRNHTQKIYSIVYCTTFLGNTGEPSLTNLTASCHSNEAEVLTIINTLKEIYITLIT